MLAGGAARRPARTDVVQVHGLPPRRECASVKYGPNRDGAEVVGWHLPDFDALAAAYVGRDGSWPRCVGFLGRTLATRKLGRL